jgi:signal recognition particle subunit SRP19
MPDHVYVYPGYLAKGGTRADGRRVPEEMAVEDLTLDGLVAAAKALGFKAEAEPEKSYPRLFYEYSGRVKITKRAGVSKTQLLRLLAEEIRLHPDRGAPE